MGKKNKSKMNPAPTATTTTASTSTHGAGAAGTKRSTFEIDDIFASKKKAKVEEPTTVIPKKKNKVDLKGKGKASAPTQDSDSSSFESESESGSEAEEEEEERGPSTLSDISQAIQQAKKQRSKPLSKVETVIDSSNLIEAYQPPAPQKSSGKDDEDELRFRDSRGNIRKKTEEGYPIYDIKELKIGLGGDTPDCPFDCQCCF